MASVLCAYHEHLRVLVHSVHPQNFVSYISLLSFYKRRNWSLILADTSVPIKLILAATTLQLKRSVSLFTEKIKKQRTPPSSDSEPQAISILWGHLVGISDLVAL